MASLRMRNWLAVWISAAVLLAALADPTVLSISRAPVPRAVLETATAIVGSMAALLVLGRFRRSHRVPDLCIVFAVLSLAWVHPLFVGIPDLISPDAIGNGVSERIELWGTSGVRLAAAGLMVLATLLPERSPTPTRVPRTVWFKFCAFGTLLLVGITLLVCLAPVNYRGLIADHQWPESAYSYFQLFGALLFLAACWCLTEESKLRSDAFYGWLATGCVFGAFSMISYGVLSNHGARWIQIGDILRAAAVGTWALGVVAEIRSYWWSISDSVRKESRHLVALDLHDGIAQELALLTTYLQAPASERALPEWHARMQSTAERALAETRRTIAALASGEPTAIETDPKQTAVSASGDRAEVHVNVQLNSAFLEQEARRRESIVRIVHEAVTNAVRHGQARHVTIAFSEADGALKLSVMDDGVGFDTTKVAHSDRFGLISMRERAEAMGASFSIESEPGLGTNVEVLWP